MQTKLIVDPMSTWSSPEPKMNASGTTTCKFTKCEITPVAVETCKVIVAVLINHCCRDVRSGFYSCPRPASVIVTRHPTDPSTVQRRVCQFWLIVIQCITQPPSTSHLSKRKFSGEQQREGGCLKYHLQQQLTWSCRTMGHQPIYAPEEGEDVNEWVSDTSSPQADEECSCECILSTLWDWSEFYALPWMTWID